MPSQQAPIGLLVFDLDDTLYPEREYVLSGFEAVAFAFRELLGGPGETSTRLRQIFDTGERTRCFNVLLREKNLPDDAELIGRMVAEYRNHRPHLSLHEDARESLAFWRGKVRTAVLSDGFFVAQENKVAALGLKEALDTIILTDQWGREFWKPHARGFETLEQFFGTAGAACAYVSDNAAKDFVAPKAMGWITVRIVRPGGTYENAPPAEHGAPAHTIHDLGELLSLLRPAGE